MRSRRASPHSSAACECSASPSPCRSRSRPIESPRGHRLEQRVCPAVEHQVGDETGGDRRKQDAVPIVPRRVYEVGHGARPPEDGQVVRCARTQTDPHFVEPGIPRRGQQSTHRVEERRNTRDRRALVEPDLLDCRPDQDRPVAPRHHVAPWGPDDPGQRSPGPPQPKQLPPHRPDRQWRLAVHHHTTCPAASRQHDGVARHRPPGGLDLDPAVAHRDTTCGA